MKFSSFEIWRSQRQLEESTSGRNVYSWLSYRATRRARTPSTKESCESANWANYDVPTIRTASMSDKLAGTSNTSVVLLFLTPFVLVIVGAISLYLAPRCRELGIGGRMAELIGRIRVMFITLLALPVSV